MNHYLKCLCILMLLNGCTQTEKYVTLRINISASKDKKENLTQVDHVLLMNKSNPGAPGFAWGLETMEVKNITCEQPNWIVLRQVPQTMKHVSISVKRAGQSYFGYKDHLTLPDSVNIIEVHIQPAMVGATVERIK